MVQFGLHCTGIPVDASTTVLKRALESVPMIEAVHITYSAGSVLCRNDSVDNIASVTFTSNFGAVSCKFCVGSVGAR